MVGQTKKRSQTIWSIGGERRNRKDFFSKSLGLLVSGNGTQLTMIDADLGTPNLHTFLGVPKADLTFAEFVNKHVPQLADVVTNTPYRGLNLDSKSLVSEFKARDAEQGVFHGLLAVAWRAALGGLAISARW